MAEQLINRIDNRRDRELLTQWFLDGEPHEGEELASLGPVGRSSYEFLANRDPGAVEELIDRLPPEAVEELRYLSPSTSIEDVKAELFIIHDRADPYIPYTESRRMEDALAEGGGPRAHFDEIRLFEHVEPKLNQRPDVITIDSTRMLFRMYQLLLRWD
jgi:fermentation-respiration switch protein FrsA (DUF1100 family)